MNLPSVLPNIDETVQNKKSCRTITLTCWITTLTALIILLDYILSWIRDMSDKDDFWKHAKKLIEIWKSMNSSIHD